eukprot:2437756-Alexandrium_andersonii.AAC.1
MVKTAATMKGNKRVGRNLQRLVLHGAKLTNSHCAVAPYGNEAKTPSAWDYRAGVGGQEAGAHTPRAIALMVPLLEPRWATAKDPSHT